MQNFARADLQRLAVIIREVTGNNIQEKNFSMVESRIRSHMIRLNIETIEQYWAYYNANEMQERMTLQSLMTTHHTFFFRERVHFEVLEKWLENESTFLVERFKKTKAPVKVWSSACSRGQEVYSLAMFLEFALYKKHGVPFEIIGTDIDAESISYAKNGVYPIKEVNAIPKSYLNGYWKKGTGPIKEFAAVHPNLKTKTKFKVLNILDLKENASNEKYDIIFCRNLFIYFAEESIHATAKKLAQRISQRGLLITGISEPLHFAGWNYESIGPSCYQIGEGIKKESKAHVINFPSPAAASTAAAPKVSTPPAAVAFVSPPAQQSHTRLDTPQ